MIDAETADLPRPTYQVRQPGDKYWVAVVGVCSPEAAARKFVRTLRYDFDLLPHTTVEVQDHGTCVVHDEVRTVVSWTRTKH